MPPGELQVQGCISWHRKVVPEDALSPANIKSKVDVSPIQLIGIRQEFKLSKMKNEAIEQLRSAEVHINVGNDDLQRRFQELEFDERAQQDKTRRFTEDLDKQRILVKGERNKARVTEILIRENEQRSLLQRPFTLYEILFVHEKADLETCRRNYKKLAAITHPDVGGCKDLFKTIHRACRV